MPTVPSPSVPGSVMSTPAEPAEPPAPPLALPPAPASAAPAAPIRPFPAAPATSVLLEPAPLGAPAVRAGGVPPFAPADALGGAVYEFEPEAEEILRDLVPRNIAVQIFRALMENAASFYGAQMSAMDNATRNAGDMIRQQTLLYNRTRQAMITKELIEIISGAEAL